MPHRQPPRLTEHARALRRNQTRAEALLWRVVRNRYRGIKFRRQVPIHPFIVDFACASAKVVVEVDGGYHDANDREDLCRQRYLESLGWVVVRFRNEDVLKDIEAVALAIDRCVQKRLE